MALPFPRQPLHENVFSSVLFHISFFFLVYSYRLRNICQQTKLISRGFKSTSTQCYTKRDDTVQSSLASLISVNLVSFSFLPWRYELAVVICVTDRINFLMKSNRRVK